jgi:hypothetical protein
VISVLILARERLDVDRGPKRLRGGRVQAARRIPRRGAQARCRFDIEPSRFGR